MAHQGGDQLTPWDRNANEGLEPTESYEGWVPIPTTNERADDDDGYLKDLLTDAPPLDAGTGKGSGDEEPDRASAKDVDGGAAEGDDDSATICVEEDDNGTDTERGHDSDRDQERVAEKVNEAYVIPHRHQKDGEGAVVFAEDDDGPAVIRDEKDHDVVVVQHRHQLYSPIACPTVVEPTARPCPLPEKVPLSDGCKVYRIFGLNPRLTREHVAALLPHLVHPAELVVALRGHRPRRGNPPLSERGQWDVTSTGLLMPRDASPLGFTVAEEGSTTGVGVEHVFYGPGPFMVATRTRQGTWRPVI